jgi:uncharacterized protein involved in copper resistance
MNIPNRRSLVSRSGQVSAIAVLTICFTTKILAEPLGIDIEEFERSTDKGSQSIDWNISYDHNSDNLPLNMSYEGSHLAGQTTDQKLQVSSQVYNSRLGTLSIGLSSTGSRSLQQTDYFIVHSAELPYNIEIEQTYFWDNEIQRGEIVLERETVLAENLTLSAEWETALVLNDSNPDSPNGIQESEISLRLIYNTNTIIKPYLGFVWSRVYANEAKELRQQGDVTGDSSWMIGLTASF